MTATNLNETADRVRRRDASPVLRMSETAAANLDGNPADPADDERMIMNMGPAHPSTHGVLRLILELQGETVLRCKPVVGYLHTGMEKTGEQLSFLQGPTNVTRMDYSSPLFNELVFSMAVETLLEIEVPERATWIRMMMCELNRMSSHLLFMATNGMDLGAVGMMIYGWREREEILRFFEKVTGLRMNHNYIRPGGVAADLPDNWQADLTELLDVLPERLDEYDILMSGQPIWRDRLQGVGVLNTAEALALGATGPILRSTGHQWDLRRDEPYLAYDQVDFDVIVGTYGDSYDRYAIRLNEIRESLRIVRQCIETMPKGDYRIQDKKVTPPPRARIDQSMEALIHHFKIFTEGFKVPEGEIYVAVESPRGELGCYLVSDGGAHPYRMHIRGPSFVNLQTVPYLLPGGVLADGVAAIEALQTKTPTAALERLVEANTLLSGLGFESSGLAAAHAIHNGLTTAHGTHSYMHGEKVAFGLLTQLMLESQLQVTINEVIAFSKSVGLPTTFAEIGIPNPSNELLHTIATRATLPGETIHNEPLPVTPAMVVEAMRAADDAGQSL